MMPVIQLQISVSITEEVAKSLATALAPAIKQALEPKPSDEDVRREARLQASRNAIFAGQIPPEDQGLFVESREVTKLLKVSAKTLWVMSRDGRMPPPIRSNRRPMELRNPKEMGGSRLSFMQAMKNSEFNPISPKTSPWTSKVRMPKC